jgi:hypothetical protein
VTSLQTALEEAPVFPIYFLCQRKFKKWVVCKNFLREIWWDPSFRFLKDIKSNSSSILSSQNSSHIMHFVLVRDISDPTVWGLISAPVFILYGKHCVERFHFCLLGSPNLPLPSFSSV